MGCGCGGRRRVVPGPGETLTAQPDPARALSAAARPRYIVRPHAGGTGKAFSTLQAAEDYARRTRGVIAVE